MPITCVQWCRDTGKFCGSFQFFFNSSTCYSVAASLYSFKYQNFCFTKLLTLILNTFFSGILLCYPENTNANVFMIKSNIRIVSYFLIASSFLKYIWCDSRIIILCGDIEKSICRYLSVEFK